MGIRGELFTTEVTLDNRTYFFNVKENRMGDAFLQVVESKSTDGSGFDRHAIVVFEEDMQRFLAGLESSLQFMENHGRIVRKRQQTQEESYSQERGCSGVRTTGSKPGRRVTVIPKKK